MQEENKMSEHEAYFHVLHEEMIQTLPDGYFSGLKDTSKFELKAKNVKPMKVKKHKRNKKKGW